MSNQKSVSLIGAGLVGSLLSIYLAKRGYNVNVFERRSDMRKNRISAGRSINLALSDRGLRGLDGIGIGDEIRKIMIPMYGRAIHNLDGTNVFQPYGKDGQAINSVSRGGINMKLMDLAETHLNVKINFNEFCTGVDLKKGVSSFKNEATKIPSEFQSDLILEPMVHFLLLD